MPRTLMAVVMVALIASASWPAASAAAASKRSCSRPGSHTVAVNRYARVYWVARADEFGVEYRHLYTCRRATRQRRLIGMYGEDPYGLGADGIVRVRLAGHYLAYATAFSCDRYTGDCGGEIVVRDLAINENVVDFVLGSTYMPPERPGGPIVLYALHLKASGSVALIAGPANDAPMQVWKLDQEGETLLDSGAGIDPHSLAAARGWVYWMRDGQPRAAAFH